MPASTSRSHPDNQWRRPPLDTLVFHWWTALDAAQSALGAAAVYLGEYELSMRGVGLGAERDEIVEILRGLSRDLHQDSRLLDLLATRAGTNRMLGLPREVSACVFDLDGVLTASASLHASAWAETFDAFLLERAERSRRQFIPFDREGEYQEYIAARPRLEGIRAFLASRGISLPEGGPGDAPDAETVHGLGNRKNLALQDRFVRLGVTAFEGSRSYLEAARMLGLRRAVVSASAHTATILERAGLTNLIDEQLDAATIEREQLQPKPAPDTLLAACERLRVLPHQVADFETTTVGITAARTAHMRVVVGVDRTGHNHPLRASNADVVINDLGELLGGASVPVSVS
jgi:beta-phosphoglucomutase-like phosphatase (HAD superfamily)